MTDRQRQLLAGLLLLLLVAIAVVWVHWARQTSRPAPTPVTRIPITEPSVVSVPQQIANAVSEAEAKHGVTAGSKFTVTIKVLTADHAEGIIDMERGQQNFTADLVGGKWQVSLQ